MNKQSGYNKYDRASELSKKSRSIKITQRVLDAAIWFIIGVMALGVISVVQASEVERGNYKTAENAVVCGSFSQWLDIYNAMLARSSDLVAHLITKSGSACVFAKPDVELVVVDSSDRWVEAMMKTSSGDFLTVWTHEAFIVKSK